MVLGDSFSRGSKTRWLHSRPVRARSARGIQANSQIVIERSAGLLPEVKSLGVGSRSFGYHETTRAHSNAAPLGDEPELPAIQSFDDRANQ